MTEDFENNFACFILTHGRPNNVMTYNSLRKSGYTGRGVFILDDEDDTKSEYEKNFGAENIYVFSKSDVAKRIDRADNFDERRSIIYARQATFEIAEDIGIEYFVQLDDDYGQFAFSENANGEYIGQKTIKNLDRVFESFLKFYKSIPAKSIAFAQGGDFIGGENSNVFKKKLSRKCMNSWFCSTLRPFKFIGTFNDDVNTYTRWGNTGDLFFTVSFIRLHHAATQTTEAGMTEAYKQFGTYVKSFYSIMYCPSSVVVGPMGKHNRLHHKIRWNNAVPRIIDQKYCKT